MAILATDPYAELDSVNDSPDFPEDDEALAGAADGPLARHGGRRRTLGLHRAL